MTLKTKAQEVLNILENGHYHPPSGQEISIMDVQSAAVEGTRLFTPSAVNTLIEHSRTTPYETTPAVKLVSATTQIAAHEWTTANPGKKIILLNFASARNPGGGFLNGAKAQEEDLCRCSGLYPTLLQCPEYYKANRKQSSLLYTDHAIYSPSVPFFRLRGTGELLNRVFLASVITMPAPNTRPYLERNPDGKAALRATFKRRWTAVIAISSHFDYDAILLGAWGCGAFGGDPIMASEEAVAAIREQGVTCPDIVFAIPDKGKIGRRNHEAFETTISQNMVAV